MRFAPLIFALLSFGCDQSAPTAPSAITLPHDVAGSGIVRGAVKFFGTPPVMNVIQANDPCCQGEPKILEQTVVVNPNQTLRNVIVYLEGAPATDGSWRSPELVDQVRCTYTPHVLAIQAGQPLRVRSSDPTLHNVHYNPQLNRAANLAMTAAGAETTIRFDQPEFIRLKCDVHPWMNAWVGVFEHSFFSVTADSGEFEIKGIPAGTYTLVAWHELYGKQKQAVTITNDQMAEFEFRFGTPNAVAG